jgi:tetratricopeptide (TPR) repeat protein
MINLAVVLRKQTRHKEAEDLYRKAMDGLMAQHEPHHSDILACQTSLAVVLEKQCKLEEAERIHRQTLHGLEKSLPAHHDLKSQCLDNFASFLRRQGKYPEAEEKARNAVEGYKITLGPDKPSTLNSLANLAFVLRLQHKYLEAWKLYKRACAGYQKLDAPSQWSRTCLERFGAMREEMKSQGIPEPEEPLELEAPDPQGSNDITRSRGGEKPEEEAKDAGALPGLLKRRRESTHASHAEEVHIKRQKSDPAYQYS